MKKIFLATALAIMGMNANAQTWGSGAVNTYTADHVGIATGSVPADAKLKVFGNVSTDNVPEIKIDRSGTTGSPANIFELRIASSLVNVINAQGYVGINQPNPSAQLHVGGTVKIDNNLNVAGNANVSSNLWVNGSAAVNGDLFSYATFNVNNVAVTGDFNSYSFVNVFHNDLEIDGVATIGAGSVPFSVPGGYNLYVSKGILTEKLKVASHSDPVNWSDFVFNKDYKLRSLREVEIYINSNKHLPEIPSAKEVAEDGIDVAGMDAKLLQKIEELTLYVIQQQKHIEQQDKKIDALTKKINN